MIKVVIFFSYFYFFLYSVLGYGFIFQNHVIKKKINKFYIGFLGAASVTTISYFTIFYFYHGFAHNIVIHTVGFGYFLYSYFKDENKKYIKNITLISFIFLSLILISKTHDDFAYYHLTFTKYLTENYIIFGMGHLNHGYNLPSSLFFLNSTFYFPLIKFYSFHYINVFFLIFFNYFLICQIFVKNNILITKLISILAIIFFNLSFNRISEYGTDKIGQLLAVIIFLDIFSKLFNNNYKNNNYIKDLFCILFLISFLLTLKTYFISYILIAFLLVWVLKENLIIFLLNYFKSICFILSFILISGFLLTNFAHTGCLVSPMSFTCFDNFFWSRELSDIIKLENWLEQWSKAGAGPNFRVENPNVYVSKFNWINNWYEKYFLTKVIDQIAIFAFSIILLFVFVRIKKNKNSINYFDKRIILVNIILIIIFLIWFTKHPTLRYGGYSAVFLFLSFNIAFIFSQFETNKNFIRNTKYLLIFIALILNLKNFHRINKELNREDLYRFTEFPFYKIKKLDSEYTIYENEFKIFHPSKKNNGSNFCWDLPTPCVSGKRNLIVKKYSFYYFIYKDQF